MRSDGSFSIGSTVWPGVSKLVEECGELQQVLGKLIATHGDTDHWDGSDLRERLVEEMGDVLGAIDFLGRSLTLRDRIRLHDRRSIKFATFVKWQGEQTPPEDTRSTDE
jgi:NTP pyrophosphatase (non-canonical NTP hydrolase)